MSDIIMTKIAIIDCEIDKLVSAKKHIDIRLTELYEQREDLIVEHQILNEPICKECPND